MPRVRTERGLWLVGRQAAPAATVPRAPSVPSRSALYQVYLATERRLATSSLLVAVSAPRFLYRVTLQKRWSFDDVLPVPKKPQSLPVVLSPQEVVQFLDAVKLAKHRAILTTCYSAGLRISEAIGLTVSAIDSERMVLRIANGKGQKDRYVMLSPKLLAILRDWWKSNAPGTGSFPASVPRRRSRTARSSLPCRIGARRARLAKVVTPHFLRHTFAVHLLTSRYLRVATTKVCSTASPLDLLPRPVPRRTQPVD